MPGRHVSGDDCALDSLDDCGAREVVQLRVAAKRLVYKTVRMRHVWAVPTYNELHGSIVVVNHAAV